MKITSEILVISWILLRSTYAQRKDYIIQPVSSNWKTAWNICDLSGLFLLPDIGLDGFKKSGIFDDFEVGELVWLNAKDVEIVYKSRVQVHLKLAQIPADSKLTAFLCHHATKTKKYANLSSLSWNEAYNKCKSSSGWTLYNVSSSKRAKTAVSLLAIDIPFWVARTVKGRIPNFVSEASNVDEMCLGVMKMADGTLAYRRDNCTEKHRYVSVPSVDGYALAITKVYRPYPLLNGEIEPDLEAETVGPSTNDRDDSNNTTSSENMSGVIVGGTFGGIVVICGAIVAIYFLRRRWRSRRDYLRSLHRYTQRHASVRGLLQNTMSRGETLSGPLQNSSSCAQDVADEPMPEEYEDCEEKRKYADCQNDVVKDIRSRYAKYPGQSSSSKGLEQLPAYQPMNGKNTLQVLPAYERYDPDLGHLLQVHGYVNKENHGPLSEQEQYDNIPDLPKKTKKKPNINDLEAYENHSTETKSIVGKSKGDKHLGDPDRNTVCSLDELEQYENYKVPKREKGRFRIIKSNKANKSKTVKKQAVQLAEPASLNDLQAYETVEPDSIAKKEIKELADLDAYENFAVK